MDMAAMYTKIIRDYRDNQHRPGYFDPDPGSYTPNSPWAGRGVGDVGTEAGGVIKPWDLYRNYADTRVLEEHYLSASNWVYYLGNAASMGVQNWSPAAAATDGDTFREFTPIVPSDWPTKRCARMGLKVYGTNYYIYSADVLARMSSVLETATSGNTNAAFQYYRNKTNYQYLATGLRSSFLSTTNVQYDGSGNITNVANGTQGDYVHVLHFNVVPDNQRANCMNLMLNDSEKGILNYNHNWHNSRKHLSTGIFASGREMLELSRNGYNSTAYDVLLNYEFPSWLYQINNGGGVHTNGPAGAYGATTMWERWNGWVSGPNGGYVNSPSVGNDYSSFNQVWNGSVGEWIIRVIGGINPDDGNPGFQNFIIFPQPGGGVTNAWTSLGSIHGGIVSSWTNSSASFKLNVTVPANTTASVYLPANDLTRILEQGQPATNAAGVLYYQQTNTYTLFKVGSGVYDFSVNF